MIFPTDGISPTPGLVVHPFIVHQRDAWCVGFHVATYLRFCDRVIAVVDGGGEFADRLRGLGPRVEVIDYPYDPQLPASRVNERGVVCHEGDMRQWAFDAAMAHAPSLVVFGDADEVPTPDAVDWAAAARHLPQDESRWYAHWVNLFGDYGHAIGGGSEWSFQNPAGNKKCLAMQPGGDRVYPRLLQHVGMEPGRHGGGRAPDGANRHQLESPRLIHLKYGSAVYRHRPESRLARHQPDVMLAGGEVVGVPAEWLWEGMPR